MFFNGPMSLLFFSKEKGKLFLASLYGSPLSQFSSQISTPGITTHNTCNLIYYRMRKAPIIPNSLV
jgi:hypothetical protein